MSGSQPRLQPVRSPKSGDRPFHPNLMARLHLQAEAISTVMVQRIQATCHDLSNSAATWQPGPTPSDWAPNQGEEK